MSRRPSSKPCPARSSADRKSTRLNSSHDQISYAVFCLKKKNKEHASLRQLIAYSLITNTGLSATEQNAGCRWVITQDRQLTHHHSRDVRSADLCHGPRAYTASHR